MGFNLLIRHVVAPFTGAWIEISFPAQRTTAAGLVAPFTGAWIEIKTLSFQIILSCWSHPSRVRGLKSVAINQISRPGNVAPFTGAWIEIRNVGTVSRPAV